MSKERAAKVMQEIFSKGTYEGDLLGINEGRKMKDTVTYPLSAIMGEEENRIEHLERELAEAKAKISAMRTMGGEMSDTPRTDVAEHNMGSVVEPHYVVDIDFAQQLERELVEAREQLRLCNVDQFTTAAELANAVAKERERCAKVCEEMANSRYQLKESIEIMLACADAIRKGE
jgi:predicted transposase YdaD